MDLWLAVTIIACAYFLFEAIKGFSPHSNSRNPIDKIFDEEENLLVKEQDLHSHIGLTKEETRALLYQYPEIPKLDISGRYYYSPEQVKGWIKKQIS
ncbi:DNA-binding protein [Sutcliffiella horikoshii]|uniref:DNA-binding protein n=1 Tax=Sutcliffiella horikoshii TaxID=79883 RepID=UPI003CFB0AB3